MPYFLMWVRLGVSRTTVTWSGTVSAKMPFTDRVCVGRRVSLVS